ncbi:MAG: FliH/SctL family protein [Pseudomonadota bacterium]
MTSMSEAESQRWQAPQFPDGPMPTAGELETLQQQAYEEAYAEAWAAGREAGYNDGLQAGQAETQQRWQLLEQTLDFLQQPVHTLDKALESQLTQMIVALVGRLFRRELAQDPEAIRGLVRDAVQKLPASSNSIDIHLHPDDAARLTAMMQEQAEGSETRWHIVADPALTAGGCKISSGQSSIDATVEQRIQQIASALLGDARA